MDNKDVIKNVNDNLKNVVLQTVNLCKEIEEKDLEIANCKAKIEQLETTNSQVLAVAKAMSAEFDRMVARFEEFSAKNSVLYTQKEEVVEPEVSTEPVMEEVDTAKSEPSYRNKKFIDMKSLIKNYKENL